ncbi:MAG: T9SS type A sorting domain-containing protein [Saprospiraceae bacterium]|nr:T9SS type A sorting domain-containing protein [Saprospiraceae bacterium]
MINLGDVSNTAGDIPGFNINQPNFGAQKANIGIQQLSMYPNPFAGQLFLQVRVANNQNTTLRLFDQLGKLARTMPINLNQGEQTVSMDFSDLHSGVYIYQINVDDQIQSGKLIKQD